MRVCDFPLWALVLTLGCASSDGGGSGGLDAGASLPDAEQDSGRSEDAGRDAAAEDDAGSSPDVSVRYVGRFDDTDPSAVRASWSGSGFVVRFRGTGARATLRGGRYFTVVVDGAVQPDPLAVSETDATYELASELADAEHTIEVYRRTEGLFGPTVVGEVEVDGELLAVPRPTRQVEIVGDSNSTGYGVEGPDAFCGFSAETENHYVTWGAIAARAVDAELSTVAWSGKGVVSNYGGDRTEPLPTLYDRVVATEVGSGGTIRQADVVFVTLGGNDYSPNGGPPDEEFVVGYVSLLQQIRGRHPDALIVCVPPRLANASATARLRSSIDEAVDERIVAGDAQTLVADIEIEDYPDLGCDFHPGIETHALLAEKAVEFLRTELGW
jgi:lysophospholipase L1-like esterase